MQYIKRLSLILTACLFFSNLEAQTKPCPGGFGISAEWLYMLPSMDQPYYVIDSAFSPSAAGDRVRSDQDWESGYRVEAIYAFCNCINDVRVRWTQFPNFNHTRSIEGPFLFPVLEVSPFIETESASFKQNYDFYYADVLFGQKVIDCCPFYLDLQAGIQYGYLRLKEKALYGSREVRLKSQFWGVGPEIGAEFKYTLWRCIDIVGRGYYSLLISERDASMFDSGVLPLFDVSDEEYWSLVSSTNLRFGLSYQTPLECLSCCGCTMLDLEFGYEVITFHNSIQRLHFPDNANQGSSLLQRMDFTVHGPYVHAGLTF